MNKQVKQKLCWNCEGSVAIYLENCLYCGVYLNPDQKELEGHEIKPHYHSNENELSIPEAPYKPEVEEEKVLEPKETPLILASRSFEAALPIILLTLGTVFALFALALYLFGEDGLLTLQWNANLWYIYALIALPALCVGIYSLRFVKDEGK